MEATGLTVPGHSSRLVLPCGLIGKIGIVILLGSRAVGLHDMSGHGPEVRGDEPTFAADPTIRLMQGQRPSAVDELAKKGELLAAQKNVANRCFLRCML